MNADIGLILDGVILVFLAVTIFYAARLTIFFKNFRASRDTVEKLIKDLSTAIDKSERSIHTMHESAAEAGEQLQAIVKEANFLSDELRFINESGDNLADRLDKLVEKNRELVDQLEDHGGVGRPRVRIDRDGFNHLDDEGWNLQLEEEERPQRQSQLRQKQSVQDKGRVDQDAGLGSFLINDRDFEEGLVEDNDAETAWSTLDEGRDEEIHESSFSSQAERDLYEALRSRGRNNKAKARIKESA